MGTVLRMAQNRQNRFYTQNRHAQRQLSLSLIPIDIARLANSMQRFGIALRFKPLSIKLYNRH